MCFVFKRNGEGNHSRRGALDSNSYPIYTSAICSPRKTTFTYLHNAGVISVTISLSIYVLRYACHKASGRKGNWKCGSIFSITIIPAIVSPLFKYRLRYIALFLICRCAYQSQYSLYFCYSHKKLLFFPMSIHQ